MTAVGLACQVGFIGITPVSLFLLERLSLNEQFQTFCITDQIPSRREQVDGVQFVETPEKVLASDASVIFFADSFTEAEVASAIAAGKHAIIDRPWLLSSQSLSNLSKKAKQANVCATYLCLQRWSVEFLTASAAIRSGRLGQLRLIDRTSREKAIPFEKPFAGAIKEIGFHWLDQLLLLNNSTPERVFASRFFNDQNVVEDGFQATISFSNNSMATIDVQTQSNLSFRTGWMIDGSLGAYRADRLYTLASDGEIVDEPFPCPVVSQDEFLRQVRSATLKESADLPTLEDAARIMELIESIERSATTGEVVR